MLQRSDIFIESKYVKWYFELMEKARYQPPIKGQTEKHHIIPEGCGGEDKMENRVNLTYRQHYISHMLLAKADYVESSSKRKMVQGFLALGRFRKLDWWINRDRNGCKTNLHAQLKKNLSCHIRGEKSVVFGQKFSEERKRLQKNGLIGKSSSGENHYLYKKKMSEEQKRKISQTLKKYSFTEEHKRNISLSKIGRPRKVKLLKS
jgi:hypothetical protein